MELNKFVESLQESLKKNHSILLVANCTITYSGRAESHLPAGDRIVIIKPDKTTLIHQHKGATPVNYMKEGSVVIANYNGENAVVNVENLPLKEYLNVAIHEVHHFHSQVLEDDKKLRLAGTEKDMSLLIMKTPTLISKDFEPLSMEEHTKYGFIDVFGHDKKGNLVVVECKRQNGDLSAVTQLRRYVEKMKKLKGVENVQGVLACPKISPNALKMLEDWGFKHAVVRPPSYLQKYDKAQQKLSSLIG
ncbi:endonuclease NucS [Candidatus Woesearchaeota archaeon]|nr:endonuclease NucS [Candidatus Woesearchaeota archaeon]